MAHISMVQQITLPTRIQRHRIFLSTSSKSKVRMKHDDNIKNRALNANYVIDKKDNENMSTRIRRNQIYL